MNEAATPVRQRAAIDWWGLLTDRTYLAYPYPELKRIQQLGPVHYHEGSGVWFVLGHREFGQIVKSPQAGRDTRLWTDGWRTPENEAQDPVGYRLLSEFQPQMINSNPPDHGRMRAVYDHAFRPGAIAAHTSMIQAEADRLLDAMPASGSADLMEMFATPLPLRVLRNLFGIPASMDERIGAWSAALIKIGDIMMTPAQKREAHDALLEFKAYLRDYIAFRRENPGNGLIDTVIGAFAGGAMDEEETLTNLVAMLIAGHETTVTLIGNGWLSLLQNPGELARLRADRKLTRSAIEEFLRYEPGGNMILRVVIEDLELDGMRVPAGSLVIGLIGAVNRDPARFDRPELLDVSRHPNPHYTFGGGIHMCIGAPLARLEADIAFNSVLNRYSSIELDGDPEWRLDRINARGLKRLPVRLGAAA
jgi:cytochrome P450